MKEVKRFCCTTNRPMAFDCGKCPDAKVSAADFDAALKDLQDNLTCAADAIRYARINFGNTHLHAKIWQRLDEALAQIEGN